MSRRRLALFAFGWLAIHPALHAQGTTPEVTGFQFLRSEGTYYVYRCERFATAGAAGAASEFVLIPRGTFTMGGERDDEMPRHDVAVAAFLLARTELTQRVWKGLVGKTGLDAAPAETAGDDLPVESVSWHDATQWSAANGLRLPSEAEWEYACRGGTKTRFFFGDPSEHEPGWVGDQLSRHGWLLHNVGRPARAREVGQLAANPFGLLDILGNVSEWCQDDWHASYVGAPADGSAWVTTAAERVVRGAAWVHGHGACWSSTRYHAPPETRKSPRDIIGMRPAVSLAPPRPR